MKRHRQLESDDCFRTCIACLLDYDAPDQVPNFMAGMVDLTVPEEVRVQINEWMLARGVCLWETPYHTDHAHLMKAMAEGQPDCHYILSGRNHLGRAHSAIYRRSDLVHDPAPGGSGVVSPGPGGYYWISVIGAYV